MRRTVDDLLARHRFDSVVCDFLFPAPNISALESCVLFAHNVEAMIWKRHVEHAAGWPRRLYFRLQARRMFAYERHVCRRVKGVITVSQADADVVRYSYGVERVRPVPTGVDVGYFAPKGGCEPKARLVFLGSMDWLPNIDGIGWFVREVWPRIHRQRPDCSVAIVGRKPTAEVVQLASVPGVEVTGTVADVRPWLWGATVSVVPLRIGGGTRLKVYEAMAARVPVVSTTTGAEGLDVRDGLNIRLADTPEDFAARCLELLASQPERHRLASTAWDMVNSRYSWEVVAQEFDRLLL